MATTSLRNHLSVAEAVDQMPHLAELAREDRLLSALTVCVEGEPDLAIVPWDLWETVRQVATTLLAEREAADPAPARDVLRSLLMHLRYRYGFTPEMPEPLTPPGDSGAATHYANDEAFLSALEAMGKP